MGSKKRAPQSKTVEYKGSTYTGTLNNGKVAVRIQRTARGQSSIAGTFDPKTRLWSNDNRSVPLPDSVRGEIERAFV